MGDSQGNGTGRGERFCLLRAVWLPGTNALTGDGKSTDDGNTWDPNENSAFGLHYLQHGAGGLDRRE